MIKIMFDLDREKKNEKRKAMKVQPICKQHSKQQRASYNQNQKAKVTMGGRLNFKKSRFASRKIPIKNTLSQRKSYSYMGANDSEVIAKYMSRFVYEPERSEEILSLFD